MKALRAVFVAAAHAVNNADRSMATVRPLTTAGGQKALSAAFVSDFDHHALQPGPQPFTPIRVQVHGSTARVTACMLHTSWSLDRRTHRPWEPRSSGPIDFELTKVGGQWKFKSGFRGTASCAGVKIVKVRW